MEMQKYCWRNDFFAYGKPLKIRPTRVWRTYEGGEADRWTEGLRNSKDSHFPENWTASLVTARNPGREEINKGLSFLS